ISVFKKIWAESWGPRMEYILRNALLALLDLPASTLLDIPKLLDDSAFRRHVLVYVRNDQVRRFWLREYENYPARFRAEAIAPIQNKIGEFLVNPILRNIVGQSKSAFDLRRVMDEGKILLVNLAKGKIGEDTSSLLGAMLVTKISLAALSRAELTEADRKDFYLYADEFPSFTTTSFAGMLSEMRKYHVGLVLAHQYIEQLDEAVRGPVRGLPIVVEVSNLAERQVSVVNLHVTDQTNKMICFQSVVFPTNDQGLVVLHWHPRLVGRVEVLQQRIHAKKKLILVESSGHEVPGVR